MDRWFGVASAGAEPGAKAFSIYQSIYIPTLTYGPELWVLTIKNGIVTKMSCARLNLRDGVRSSE